MPKKRNKPGTRQFEKRLFILCEGAKDCSESSYLKAFIRDCRFKGQRVLVRVVDTAKNTGKELVKEAKKLREFADDILWIVYDQDGYTKHPETFDSAKSNHINVAFSAVSFEYWILLHFEFTSSPFADSEEIITRLKKKHEFFYGKTDAAVYSKTKMHIRQAMLHAVRIQTFHYNANPDRPVYEYNPYTNLDKLIENVRALEDKH